MGTFHDDKGDLHGITVVAEAGDTVYVGRCDTIDASGVILLDCDRHAEGDGSVLVVPAHPLLQGLEEGDPAEQIPGRGLDPLRGGRPGRRVWGRPA